MELPLAFRILPNREAYEDGLYSGMISFKETPLTRKLKSDGSGMWLISENIPKIDGVFEGNEVLIHEIFHEPFSGSDFNNSFDESIKRGFAQLGYSSEIRIVGRGCFVTRKSIDSSVLNGVFSIYGKFDNEEVLVQTVTEFEIVNKPLLRSNKEGFKIEFKCKITMNSVDLALSSLKVYDVKRGFTDPSAFEYSSVSETIKSSRKSSNPTFFSRAFRIKG